MPDPKKPTRKPAARPSARKPRGPKAPPSEYLRDREAAADPSLEGDEPDEMEGFSARPVAVGGPSGLSARLAEAEGRSSDDDDDADDGGMRAPSLEDIYGLQTDAPPAPAPVTGGKPVIERPGDELVALVVSVLLAASVFLPWYKGPGSLKATYSGWETGTWGPVVFFLALAAAAILGLRRAGVNVAFPVDHAIVIEGIGWVCTVGILLKNLRRPVIGFGQVDRSILVFISLLLAVGLALVAGRMSSGAAFVMRPGWFASSAGKVGALVLVLAIGASAAFGLTNSASTGGPATAGNVPRPKISKGIPPCAKKAGIPAVAGIKATRGVDVSGSCYVVYETSLKPTTALKRFAAGLRAARWTIKGRTPTPFAGGQRLYTYSLLKPRCGGLQMTATKSKVKSMTLSLTPCAPAVQPSR